MKMRNDGPKIGMDKSQEKNKWSRERDNRRGQTAADESTDRQKQAKQNKTKETILLLDARQTQVSRLAVFLPFRPLLTFPSSFLLIFRPVFSSSSFPLRLPTPSSSFLPLPLHLTPFPPLLPYSLPDTQHAEEIHTREPRPHCSRRDKESGGVRALGRGHAGQRSNGPVEILVPGVPGTWWSQFLSVTVRRITVLSVVVCLSVSMIVCQYDCLSVCLSVWLSV